MIVAAASESAFRIGTTAAAAIDSARNFRRLATFLGVEACDIASSYIGADFVITSVTSAITPFWYFINDGIQQTNLIVV